MVTNSARVVDLADYRRQRREQTTATERPAPAATTTAPMMMVWCPVFLMVPIWH